VPSKGQALRSDVRREEISSGVKFILTPIDFSATAHLVINEAAALASASGAHIILLEVAPPPTSARTPKNTVSPELQKLERDLLGRGLMVHALRVTGDPVQGIVEQAEKLDAMCIVMGTRSYSRSPRLAAGSTVRAVLARTIRPVVLVPKRKRQPTARSAARRSIAYD
jgi:nucleotide-binding universal stress UspA family protein